MAHMTGSIAGNHASQTIQTAEATNSNNTSDIAQPTESTTNNNASYMAHMTGSIAGNHASQTIQTAEATDDNNTTDNNTSQTAESTTNNTTSQATGNNATNNNTSQATGNTTNNNTSQATGNSSYSNPSQTPSTTEQAGGNQGNGNSGSTHQHTWEAQYQTVHHDEAGHYVTVYKEAYDEPIYETHYVCNYCGLDITASGQSVVEHCIPCGYPLSEDDLRYVPGIITTSGSSYGTKDIQVGTIHHEAVTEEKWMVDKKAYDEKVFDGYKCTTCGATKK
ncbi:MAG: hypothetical protein NC240_11430 [Clostridium sp.]|nr:hypothetical protein [Clostridium sp.]